MKKWGTAPYIEKTSRKTRDATFACVAFLTLLGSHALAHPQHVTLDEETIELYEWYRSLENEYISSLHGKQRVKCCNEKDCGLVKGLRHGINAKGEEILEVLLRVDSDGHEIWVHAPESTILKAPNGDYLYAPDDRAHVCLTPSDVVRCLVLSRPRS